MAKMKAILRDVELTFPDDPDHPLETVVGVLEGAWDNGMMETGLDDRVYFWFDSVDDLVEGEEIGDGVVISRVFGEPYESEDEYEPEDED